METGIDKDRMIYLYELGLTYADIGKKYDVSKQRIQQIIGKHTKTRYLNPQRQQKRFWRVVEKTDKCWLWLGYIDPEGYGRFGCNGKTWLAHRFSKSLTEPLDPKLTIDHLCRVRHCVNPNHLEQVTSKVNTYRAPVHLVHGNIVLRKGG